MNCKELEINVQPGEPFKHDLFGLSSFADMLTGIVDSYSDTGAVITLNGEWGIGKTHFWNNIIKNKIDSVDDLLKFNIEGYTYNDELSNGEVITFTRKNI